MLTLLPHCTSLSPFSLCLSAYIFALYLQYSANGGTATIDLKTKTVYANLLDYTDGNTPYFFTVDAITGTNCLLSLQLHALLQTFLLSCLYLD